MPTAKHQEPLQTAWSGSDLLVLRGNQEIDRLSANDIERVILVCRGAGQTPGDLSWALFELPAHHVLLPASSGVAGRVHFERTAYWSARNCIYWVSEPRISLPRRLLPGWISPMLSLVFRQRPGYMRVSRAELAPLIDRWPLEGPETWEQRKWARIERSRPFAQIDAGPATHRTGR